MRNKNRFSFNAWMDTSWPLIIILLAGFVFILLDVFYPFWLM